MRNILILALGSRGDVQPYITLGHALRQAGHAVRVATFALFESRVRKAGLDFLPIHGDAEGLLRAASQQGMLAGAGMFKTIRALGRSYGSLAASLPADLAGSKLHGTDLVLNQLPCNLFGWDIAEYLGVPHAMVSVIPLARSRHRPLMGFPTGLRVFPGYNRFTFYLGEQIGWQMFRASVNLWRKQAGLASQALFGAFERMEKARTPIVNGFSERVIPRPADWGTHIHSTGWWMPEDLDPDLQDGVWNPPDDLLRFLQSGSPPVFVGFGSMPVPHPEQTTTLVIQAIQSTGQRAILHTGWAGLGGTLPETIHPIDYAPYRWLFPRMSALVHHGGSGTTGYALSSGTPSFVVPFGFDQGEWGSRGAALGVGPKPLPFKALKAGQLAQRIHDAVNNPAYPQAAAALANLLRAEKGVLRAARIIEQLT
ncbi:MAG: glycosyltransferase family 1 protein [Anaerolineae bacterium]|nr:glycosyltransferase family 1 protein [Anaerolineae bacterium]